MKYISFTKSFHIVAYVCVGIAAFFTSCKTEYPDLPYADIETFILDDANGNPLQAVIKDQDIIVYWTPLEDEPETISPVITLSAGASISPASGEAVPYSEDTEYTVTAQDGTKKTYTLRPEGGQPIPYFTINTNPSFGGILALGGEYFITDPEKTKVYLVQNETEYELEEITRLYSGEIQAKVPFELSVDTGEIDVKLVTGRRTVVNGPYRLLRPSLQQITNMETLPTTVKRGESFDIELNNERMAAYYKEDTFTSFLELNVSPYPRTELFTGTKFNGMTITVKIPEDIDPGNYYFKLVNNEPQVATLSIPSLTIE